MHIVVKLHGNLRKYLPPQSDGRELDLGSGATVAEALATVGIPDAEVWVVSVNGVLAEQDGPLEWGDVVDVFAPVAGG